MKKHLPLFVAITQVIITFILFFQFMPKETEFPSPIVYNGVKSEMRSALHKCGDHTYISWIIVDFNKHHDKYDFIDVLGYDGSNIFSIKNANLNPYYNRTQPIDAISFKYFYDLPNESIGYYDMQKDINVIPVIQNALNHTNVKIGTISFGIKRTTSMAHLFTITQEIGYNRCNQHDMTELLRKIFQKI